MAIGGPRRPFGPRGASAARTCNPRGFDNVLRMFLSRSLLSPGLIGGWSRVLQGELPADIRDGIRREVWGVPIVGFREPKGLLHVLGGLSLLQAHLHLGHEPFQELAEIHQVFLATWGTVRRPPLKS